MVGSSRFAVGIQVELVAVLAKSFVFFSEEIVIEASCAVNGEGAAD